MALKKEVYKALEDIVGVENISEAPVILDSYAWRSGMAAGTNSFVTRFEAVILPKDTEEVQAIVRLCNQYKIQFKASSTGWGRYCDPFSPSVIKLDLRRMNRILEINVKNMYAVVEPYVIYAQLQAELMKRGLICNVTGAGSNCSALPLAAHQGIGHLSQSLSYNDRNQLALEWVTPLGEIVRLGSLGSLGEWFCGDGPGPSLRGIVRGTTVPLGGLGVFTKAAQKVYHWPGSPILPIEGVSPHYALSQIPPGFSFRYISWPSLEKLSEAVYKIGMSEIALEIMGFNPAMMAGNIATNNEEELKIYRQFSDLVQGPGAVCIIAGNSSRDFRYKERVLKQILEETDGKSLEPVDDPEVNKRALWHFIRITCSIRETCRSTGAFGGHVGGTDVFPLMRDYIVLSTPLKADLIKRGLIRDDGILPFTQSIEHGHQGHAETLIRYLSSNAESAKAGGEYFIAGVKLALENNFGVPGLVSGDAIHDMYGPHVSNYHLWLREIKKTFDPNATSEPSNYISGKSV